jgi:hypothetical protein
MASWSISRPFGIFNGHLVYFPHFGMLYHDKSGNPAAQLIFGGKISRKDFVIVLDLWVVLKPSIKFETLPR